MKKALRHVIVSFGLARGLEARARRELKDAAAQVEKERKEAAPKGAARAEEARRDITTSVRAMESKLEKKRDEPN